MPNDLWRHLHESLKKYPLVAWFFLCIVFCSIFYWHAHSSLVTSVSQQLQQNLPLKLKNALYYSDKNGPVVDLITHELNKDLSQLPHLSSLALFKHCQGHVSHLLQDLSPFGNTQRFDVEVHWQMDNTQHQTTIDLACETQLTGFIFPIGTASLLFAFILYLPLPLSTRSRDIKGYLTEQDYPPKVAVKWAIRLAPFNAIQFDLFQLLHQSQDVGSLIPWLERGDVATLSESQISWFKVALNTFMLSKEQALAAALSEDELRFAPDKSLVYIRGLAINLIKTPYLYYLWYAYLRKEAQGWHLNPPINRADSEGAQGLIDLMQTYGGHSKAISDLRELGLRAKTLDQNRNKLKIELVALLGETLAKPYLFDTERDLKTGRNRYRLALSAAQIHLPVTNISRQA